MLVIVERLNKITFHLIPFDCLLYYDMAIVFLNAIHTFSSNPSSVSASHVPTVIQIRCLQLPTSNKRDEFFLRLIYSEPKPSRISSFLRRRLKSHIVTKTR